MLRKLLLALFLLSCLWAVGYSQDIQLEKQWIVSELENIESQLIVLETKLQNSEILIISLQNQITSLTTDLKNSLTASDLLRAELRRHEELLQKSEKAFRELQTTYEELFKQSESLYKRLNSLENNQKILVGGLITAGIIIVVESLILFTR